MIQRVLWILSVRIASLVLVGACAFVAAPWLAAGRLELVDPEAQADAAIARGDLRIVAIDGQLLYTPGAERLQDDAVSGLCTIRLVGPRGDIMLTQSMWRWGGATHSYARAYNRRLLVRVPQDRLCRLPHN